MTQTNNNGGSPGWMAQLGDDLKANETLTKFENVSDLGRAFIEADGKLSNSVPLLTQEATAEQKAEFYNRLGRPEKPDGYELQRPQLPEGMQYSEEAEAQWRGIFHELGLSNEQAKGLHAKFNELQAALYQAEADARVKAVKDGEAALRKEWGDKYDANTELMRRAVIDIGGDALKQVLDQAGLGNHPTVLKAFHQIGVRTAEDSSVRGDGGGDGGITTDANGMPVFEYENSPNMGKEAV